MNEKSELRKLEATLFKLEGLSDMRYKFRVLKIREKIPDDNRRPIRIQRWADFLWRNKLFCPVYPTSRFDKPSFLIPLENSPSVGETVEIKGIPERIYHIDVSNDIVEVSIDQAEGPERELVCRMLERAFTDRLRKLKNLFWKSQWTLFFRQKPENINNPRDVMDAYRGIKFGVVILENLGPFLAADVRTRYVGHKSLSQYSAQDKEIILKDHLNVERKVEERASFIRDNGAIKIPCRYAGDAGKTIENFKISSSDETVLDYYRKQYPHVSLDPRDKAVFVVDRIGKYEPIPVPESRLFPVFTTEYEGVRKCSIQAQMTPLERMNTLNNFLSYIERVKYGDIVITVQKKPLEKERTVFVPPRLEFGKGAILDPFIGGQIPDKSHGDFDTKIVKWRSRKMPALYQNGPYHNESLPNIVLVYPDTIERSIRETFLRDLGREILKQTGQRINVIKQRSYPIGRKEKRGSSLLKIANELKSDSPRSLALVILWDDLSRSVHGDLKEIISPVLSQCTTERTVKNICNQINPQRAQSQVRNLALGILTEAGVKPWVIADSLHHDLYIGIDTLFGRVVYHYLYGFGARIIESQVGEALTRGRQEQAIKRHELFNRLVNPIRNIVTQGNAINSIIIHRDGRWWKSENLALHEALKTLEKEKVLSDVKCAVVEVRKNHKPIRLFTKVEEDHHSFFQNPLPGTYLVIDKNQALVSTTGRPGAWDVPGGRTAGTILLKMVERIGEASIEEVVKDVYSLTQLNWNAPDIEISLPVTIRWTDEALRETFKSAAKDNNGYELEEDEEGEEEETEEFI